MATSQGMLLLLGASAATLVLLLALWRLWAHRRAAWEWTTFAIAGGGTALAAHTWAPVWQATVLPLLLLGELAALFAVSAWRFSPDCGQSGWRWVGTSILAPTISAALGLATALLTLAVVRPAAAACTVPALWLGAAAGLGLAQRCPRTVWADRPRARPFPDVAVPRH